MKSITVTLELTDDGRLNAISGPHGRSTVERCQSWDTDDDNAPYDHWLTHDGYSHSDPTRNYHAVVSSALASVAIADVWPDESD